MKQIEQIDKPPRPGRLGGLGDKVEATLQRWSVTLFNSVKDRLVDILAAGLGLFLEVLEQALAPRLAPFIDDIPKEDLPPSVRDYLGHLKNPTSQAEALGLGGMATSLGMSASSAFLAPAMRLLNYAMDKKIQSARPDPGPGAMMGFRDLMAWNTIRTHLKDLGWSEDYIDHWTEAVRPRPPEMDLLILELRGEIGAEEASERLAKRGWKAEDRNLLRETLRFIPPPADLISMAVREAWRDDVAEKWGYDADFPPGFAEWMAKQGDRDGWAQKYWRAHWDLPGLNTVLDILYRVDDFTLEDLDVFLRVSDIPATWRDYIKRVAYRPLTRVDVRRMYRVGVLGYDDVLQSYSDLGYDETNAQRMADFTVAYETEEERGATKTDILSGLSLGMLSGTEAVDWLRTIGYSEETAIYLVAREIQKIERKRIDQRVKRIRNLYIHHELTPPQASTQLSAIGVTAGEIQAKLDEWDIDREAKTERPSRATLEKFFRRDVVTEPEFTDGLTLLGYQPKYIEWYLSNALEEKAEAARKEEEKSRDEQEAIRKRKVKSGYQVGKAALDVDIAEVQTGIAEVQLATRERKLRYQRESRIAREALSEVELRERAAKDIGASEGQIKELDTAIAFLAEQVDRAQTEIADIKLRALEVEHPDHQEAMARQVRELQLQIETLQDEIAVGRVATAEHREQIHQRRLQLQEELAIVARIRTLAEVEKQFLTDLTTMQTTLTSLRTNLAELREQKALLAVGYRVGLAEAEE